MIPVKTQEMILQLHENGVSIRQIVSLLKVSRNTIRRILHGKTANGQKVSPQREKLEPRLLTELYQRCQGNAVRIQEILHTEHNQTICYSTITRLIRELQLRQDAKKISGSYHFAPGEEMQHDTSPHKITLNGTLITAQCASLVLAFSRKIFIKYYSRFTRFEAKLFLKEACEYMDGSCGQCIIDNTSVIIASGSGATAVIVPEMAILLDFFSSKFKAHEIGHADRKAFVERSFYYVERNFLPGRFFTDFDDLNQQARKWCDEVANEKVKRSLGMTPQTAYIQEKPYLKPLPKVMPAIYELHHRIVDVHGFINLDLQRYSVPQKYIGKQMEVYKNEATVEIYHHRTCVAKHQRLVGKTHQTSRIKGHHEQLHSRTNRRHPCQEELLLRDKSALLDQFIDELKTKVRGRGKHALQKLLHLKRTYPQTPFLKAIEQALHYRMFDMYRLEIIILKMVAGDFFNIGEDA